MITTETKQLILQAIDKETENAKQNWGNIYASSHEAWAVLREEIEESGEELFKINNNLNILWGAVKDNKTENQIKFLEFMQEALINLLCEACQIGAVISKYQATLENKK